MSGRKSITDNQHLILYEEVSGICPLCRESLLYKKGNKHYKKYEVAHIYPLNATKDEEVLLKNEELLSKDLNHLDNLICLCPDCHTKFDKPRTVEEYQGVIKIKKEIIKNRKEQSLSNSYQLEKEITIIIKELLKISETEIKNIDLEYSPKTVDEKIKSDMSFIAKRSIKNYVQDYFHFIKLKFKEIETLNPGTFDLISVQIKAYFLALKKEGFTKAEIFSKLTNWLNKKNEVNSKEACEIIISFFIQNCEVF